jgi:thiosulfate/3-mercaptopyruvate sulfurtransferase
MPNSVSIPFTALLASHEYKIGETTQGTYTTLLDPGDLRQAFINMLTESDTEQSGERSLDRILRGEKAVVASCGSGMTAAVIWLALHELGCERQVSLYDEVCESAAHVARQSLAGPTLPLIAGNANVILVMDRLRIEEK